MNNVIEQDHRAVQQGTRPLLGFKAFEAAQATLAGIELMHLRKQRHLVVEAGDESLLPADQCSSLAAEA